MRRRILFGIVLPILILALTIWWRIGWAHDVHPVQPEWCMWVGTLCLTSVLVGFGIRAYWWPDGGKRRRFRG